jgi:hypothetical protein
MVEMTTVVWYPSGHDNWLSVAKPGADFKIEVNARAKTFYKNLDDAANYTAQLLYKEWGHKKLYLPLSGGLDSEYCATVLLKNKIPFTPVILQLAGTNNIESWFAEYWCYVNKITPIVINLSQDDIKDKLFLPYLPEMHPISYQWCVLINLFLADYANKNNAVSIVGVGDPHFDFETKNFYLNYVDFPLDIHRPGLHPSAFFIYTPEIMLSSHYQVDTDINLQYNKLRFYNLLPRPKIQALNSMVEINPTCKKIINRRRRKMTETPEPKWLGTKDNIIELLSPIDGEDWRDR